MANETTDAISKELAKYDNARFHVLLPKSVASQACDWIVPRFGVVEINPNPDAGDIYPVGRGSEDEDDGTPKNASAKYGLAKPAIMRLANAAGIDFDPVQSRALSASADYVLYQAVGDMRGPDGTRITGSSTKEIDLRVKEAEIRDQKQRAAKKPGKNWSADWIEKMVQSELLQWRKNKFMRAETGAQERVVKALLAMRPAYTMAELQLPFVVVRFDINFNHPTIKKMFESQGAFAAQALYGGNKAKFFLGASSTVIDADAVISDEDEAPAPFTATQPEPGPTQTAPAATPRFDPVAAAQDMLDKTEPVNLQEALPKAAATEPLGQPVPAAKTTGSEPTGDQCTVCGVTPTAGVVKFSRERFGKVICMKCRDKAGGQA